MSFVAIQRREARKIVTTLAALRLARYGLFLVALGAARVVPGLPALAVALVALAAIWQLQHLRAIRLEGASAFLVRAAVRHGITARAR